MSNTRLPEEVANELVAVLGEQLRFNVRLLAMLARIQSGKGVDLENLDGMGAVMEEMIKRHFKLIRAAYNLGEDYDLGEPKIDDD